MKNKKESWYSNEKIMIPLMGLMAWIVTKLAFDGEILTSIRVMIR